MRRSFKTIKSKPTNTEEMELLCGVIREEATYKDVFASNTILYLGNQIAFFSESVRVFIDDKFLRWT